MHNHIHDHAFHQNEHTNTLIRTVTSIGPLSPIAHESFTWRVSTSPPILDVYWSHSLSDCPSIHYTILSSNCGSCPTTTTNTTITCTDVPSNGGVCTFAVQTVVCENITGSYSNNTTIALSAITMATPTQSAGPGMNLQEICANENGTNSTISTESVQWNSKGNNHYH